MWDFDPFHFAPVQSETASKKLEEEGILCIYSQLSSHTDLFFRPRGETDGRSWVSESSGNNNNHHHHTVGRCFAFVPKNEIYT
mmetsp:Transcript_21348/g.24432  ORF Transcript_21348/g.24432 Transcript_21348/m.24432 type:complete len:83 (+) Transcript_21348:63-311(+)